MDFRKNWGNAERFVKMRRIIMSIYIARESTGAYRIAMRIVLLMQGISLGEGKIPRKIITVDITNNLLCKRARCGYV